MGCVGMGRAHAKAVRRIEHGWDGFDGLSRIRLKNRDRGRKEGTRRRKKARARKLVMEKFTGDEKEIVIDEAERE